MYAIAYEDSPRMITDAHLFTQFAPKIGGRPPQAEVM